MIKNLFVFILIIQLAFGITILLDNDDNEKIKNVNIGDNIIVKLNGETSNEATWSWSVPEPSDSKVLHLLHGKEWPNGDAMAVFKVEKSGSSKIKASKTCEPKPGFFCTLNIQLWEVTVNAA
ncbi:unnamed protein product [Cunninghamella blakesleeana]